MSLLHRTKQGISLLVGVSVSATCTHILFVLCAVHRNYFYGVDPASTVAYLPLIVATETFVGIALLGLLRVLGCSTCSRPQDLLLLGLVLGWGAVGNALDVWADMPSLSVLAALCVLGASAIVALRDPQSAASARDG